MRAHGRAFCYSLEIRSDPLWRTAAAATDGEQAARAAASARLRELLCLRLRKAGRDKVLLQLPVGLQLLPVLGELEDVDRRERDVAEDRNHRKRPKDLQSQSTARLRSVGVAQSAEGPTETTRGAVRRVDDGLAHLSHRGRHSSSGE